MANPPQEQSSALTVGERVRLAADMLADITTENNQYSYLGIGKNTPWSVSDTKVSLPSQSVNAQNQLRRDLVAIKKLSISNGCLVIGRKDWTANTYYDNFTDTDEMYSTSTITNANGTISTSGTTTITGTNTTFLLDYSNNSLLTLPGDGIVVYPQTREIVNVLSNTSLSINLAFSNTFTSNSPQKTVDYSPSFAKNFYVRNSYDQVFLCLDNNFGALSTDMPKISLGGQLPSDPYVITSDGYKWKYLYTISGGLKQAFFTSQWMPVIEDDNVRIAAVPGRIDVIKVLNGGTGYNNSSASLAAPILNIIGDGVGANVKAEVDANGTIYGVSIINGGTGYTTATVTANAGSTGANANLLAIIAPTGGFGANNYKQLGATTAMFSINLIDTESGTIPTVDAIADYFSYRQVSLIQSPQLAAGGYATGVNYSLTYTITCSSNTPFAMGDIVYQSPTGLYSSATFTGVVVYFNNNTNELHINNTAGAFTALSQIYATKSTISTPYTTSTAFNMIAPTVDPFSGDLLYIENREPIVRSPGQTENVRLII